jgi:hypothetical protein
VHPSERALAPTAIFFLRNRRQVKMELQSGAALGVISLKSGRGIR